MTTRRELLFTIGAGALAVPLASFAQQKGKAWRVGFLALRRVEFVDADYYYGPFMQGMRELGYIEGKNLVMEWRSAEGKADRLPDLAAELVRLKVDVLIAAATPPALAAQKATTSIPIVMTSADPVENRLVKSLARPGGNITGLTNITSDLDPKRLEMLRAVVPKASRIAVLVNPTNPSNMLGLKNIQIAAQRIGQTILPVEARTAQEIANGITEIVRQGAAGFITPQDGLFVQQNGRIVDLAVKHRLPTVGAHSDYAEAGGLMSYGNNIRENYRRMAVYVDKIFKGERPADMPVEQPTKFELIINMKTAKALGITIPPSVLVQANRVIE